MGILLKPVLPGLQGDTGAGGDTGVGTQGDTGVGTQGDTGIGDTGQQGDTGVGDTGVGQQGDTGVGDTGQAGDTGVGDTGQPGDTGIGQQGDTGIGTQGDTGQAGDTGIGDTGVGTQGDTGVGDTGQPGDTGVGTQGDTGIGDTGIQGDTGVGGAATGQILLRAEGGYPSTTNGCSLPFKREYVTNDVDVYILAFDKDSDEFAQWKVPLPADYDGGTMTGIVAWTAEGGGGGETVAWNIQGRSYADDEAIDQAWGDTVEVSDTWIADGDVHISATSAAITLAGTPAGGEMAMFRTWRDVSDDDLGCDADFLWARLTFTRS